MTSTLKSRGLYIGTYGIYTTAMCCSSKSKNVVGPRARY